MAQVIMLVWHTFTFNLGLPILFAISIVNLSAMYWMDKYLLLRVCKTPVNINEEPIQIALIMMYWAFLFHFLVGFGMVTNDGILSTNSQATGLDDITGVGFFSAKRYQSYHA